MFGFSLTKLVVLAVIILAVWYGYKYVTRLTGQGNRVGRQGPDAEVDAADMVKCPICDTYLPRSSAKNCGKPNCPY